MKLSAAILTSVGVVLLALGTAAASQEICAGLSTLQVGYEIYQVRSGDTIENIAVRYGVTPQSIRSVNAGLRGSRSVSPSPWSCPAASDRDPEAAVAAAR
jgi:spore germination protein YaaH